MTSELTIILAAAVGALAALLGSVIPALIKERADRKAAEVERYDRRKNDLIKVEKELIERDIYKIEEAADSVLITMRLISHIAERQNAFNKLIKNGRIMEDIKKEELAKLDTNLAKHNEDMRRNLMLSVRRAYSLGESIKEGYLEYDDIIGRLHKSLLGQTDEEQKDLWFLAYESGGKLQEALRSKITKTMK